jgi:hypothetical protein
MRLTIFSAILFLIFICIACESHQEIQEHPKEIRAESREDKRIEIYINNLGDKDKQLRETAIKSLIDIANERSISRENVVSKLINRFDVFRSDKRLFIQIEEFEELQSYLKLFLELNAVEALDVMVKYINSREQISSMNTLIGKAVIRFGEDAIPSLEKGLNSQDEWMRCTCAATLCSLKFKRDKEAGINQSLKILENSKENETNKDAARCIDQAIMTLNERKLPNYPLEGY